MTHPKISVIMPCYKAQDTVRCAIESVRQQSFSDFELLVVDDGSTDGSPAIAAAMVLDDRRIRLIRQRNAGPAAARNRGLAESTGDFIAFLDADDRWVGTLLARHLRLAQQNPLCGVSFGRVRFYDPELRHAGRMSSPPPGSPWLLCWVNIRSAPRPTCSAGAQPMRKLVVSIRH